jgi:hypothetical protein
MSRLDSFIRRLEAQRACLEWAIAAVCDVPGVVIELGLGNGRTYDHLRAKFCGTRQIYAFDRRLTAHPETIPDPDHLIVGEFRDTLPAFAKRIGAGAALVHVDAGSGDEAASRAQAQALVRLIDPALAEGGLVVSDQDMAPDPDLAWRVEKLPANVPAGRYFIYRKAARQG